MAVTLRKIEPTDLPFLYQWENDATAWVDGATHNPLSQKDLREFIATSTGDIYRDGQLRLIALSDGQTVGCVDLIDFDPRNRKAEVGIYVSPNHRRQGTGYQILRLIADYAHHELNMRLLYATVRRSNEAAAQLFIKAGYHEAGILPKWTLEDDAILYVNHNDNDNQ